METLTLLGAPECNYHMGSDRCSVRESELYGEKFLRHAPDLVYLWDGDGRILLASASSSQVTEFTPEELLQHGLYDLIDPSFRTTIEQFYLGQRYNGPEVSYIEFPIVTKSGAQRWIGQRTTVVREGGSVTFYAIARILTQPLPVETKQGDAERLYQDMFENAVQGMFRSSVNGEIIAANSSLLKLLGYRTLEELKKCNLVELYVDPVDRTHIANILIDRGRCSNLEIRLKRRDGRSITVLEHARAIKDSAGNVIMFEGIIEDVSARKAVESTLQRYVAALKSSQEELERTNTEKDKLYSILSHDLRSPFGSILGFCDVLLKESDQLTPDERTEYLTYIRESAQEQLALLNNLLDWSHLESGHKEAELIEVNLHEIVRKSILSLLGLAKEKGVALVSSIPEETLILGDQNLLIRLFSNLLSNALKFTPSAGSVTVSLKNRCCRGIIINVSDSGIGIPEDILPKLFKVEEKYSTTGLRGERGTGLGLPMCREIMEKHHGSIAVENNPHIGTTFQLTFPEYTLHATGTVLVVDDDPRMRKLHIRHVKKFFPDATLLEASDGAEALALALRSLPQVVVSDYAMPNMDGFELLTEMKKHVSLRNIPIIFVTGDGSEACRDSLKLCGAFEVLEKPIDVEGFMSVLRRILK